MYGSPKTPINMIGESIYVSDYKVLKFMQIPLSIDVSFLAILSMHFLRYKFFFKSDKKVTSKGKQKFSHHIIQQVRAQNHKRLNNLNILTDEKFVNLGV